MSGEATGQYEKWRGNSQISAALNGGLTASLKMFIGVCTKRTSDMTKLICSEGCPSPCTFMRVIYEIKASLIHSLLTKSTISD